MGPGFCVGRPTGVRLELVYRVVKTRAVAARPAPNEMHTAGQPLPDGDRRRRRRRPPAARGSVNDVLSSMRASSAFRRRISAESPRAVAGAARRFDLVLGQPEDHVARIHQHVPVVLVVVLGARDAVEMPLPIVTCLVPNVSNTWPCRVHSRVIRCNGYASDRRGIRFAAAVGCPLAGPPHPATTRVGRWHTREGSRMLQLDATYTR